MKLAWTFAMTMALSGCAEGQLPAADDDDDLEPEPTYDGVYVGEIVANVDVTQAGDEPVDAVSVRLGEPELIDDSWGGDVTVEMVVLEPVRDEAGLVVFDAQSRPIV